MAKKNNRSMYDPYQSPYFSQRILCHHVYQFPETASHRSCSVKIVLVLKSAESFTGKHLYWSLVFNNVAGLRTAVLKMSVPATKFTITVD